MIYMSIILVITYSYAYLCNRTQPSLIKSSQSKWYNTETYYWYLYFYVNFKDSINIVIKECGWATWILNKMVSDLIHVYNLWHKKAICDMR